MLIIPVSFNKRGRYFTFAALTLRLHQTSGVAAALGCHPRFVHWEVVEICDLTPRLLLEWAFVFWWGNYICTQLKLDRSPLIGCEVTLLNVTASVQFWRHVNWSRLEINTSRINITRLELFQKFYVLVAAHTSARIIHTLLFRTYVPY